MSAHTFSRRAAIVGAGALALATSRLAAQSTPVASPQASPAAGAFPVTIEHFYGSTTIESRPQRVVTIGWSSYDACIALGVIPVAVPELTWGGDAEGFLPWTRAAIGDNPLPVTLDTTDGIPYEDVIGVTPDLILAPYSGFTEEEYATLSGIAPTVPFTDAPWSASWEHVTRITGLALGLAAEAEQLIADTDAMVQAEAAKFPTLAGKSFIYGNMGDGSTAFNIYTVTDPRPQFLESIGLVPAEMVTNLEIAEETPYFTPISYERANELVADIVVFWFTDEGEYQSAQAQPFFQLIPAVQNGTFAAIVGQSYVMATSAFSSLSIAYALEEFLPTLAAAAENVPA